MDSRIEIRPGRNIKIYIHKNLSSQAVAFLIHGLGGRGAQWHNQIEVLKRHYSVIVPDLLGHGLSDKPIPEKNNPFSFHEFEQDLDVIFNRYATDQNIIMGHSFGGALATALAMEHQDKIQKLILIAPTPCAPSMQIPFVYRLPCKIMEWIRPLLEWHFQRVAFDPEASRELVKSEMQANKENPMYLVCSIIKDFPNIKRIDVRKLFIPTLIILGVHDKLILPEYSRLFYQSLPHHQIIAIKHAAHLVILEQPKEVNAAIENFLIAKQ